MIVADRGKELLVLHHRSEDDAVDVALMRHIALRVDRKLEFLCQILHINLDNVQAVVSATRRDVLASPADRVNAANVVVRHDSKAFVVL